MQLDIAVRGVDEETGKLLAMGERGGDARPLWRQVAPELLGSERRQFRRGFTRKVSSSVQVMVRRPRTGKTVRQRRSRTRYSLVDTGRLRRSLTKASLVHLAGGDSVMEPSGNQLRFGTSVFYAKFLRKRGFNLIGVDRRARAEITDKTAAFLKGDL